jgi:integrase
LENSILRYYTSSFKISVHKPNHPCRAGRPATLPQSRATIHWPDDSNPDAVVIPPIDIKKSLAVAAEKVGLPKLTRHMMRHTFATFLGSKGATDMDLMDLGGWKSVAMVRRYRKVVDERLDDVMDAFNEKTEEQASER